MPRMTWNEADWRRHEAEQCRLYMAGREAERIVAPVLHACTVAAAEREAAGLAHLPISGETEARVARLLLEQPAWDCFFREGERRNA